MSWLKEFCKNADEFKDFQANVQLMKRHQEYVKNLIRELVKIDGKTVNEDSSSAKIVASTSSLVNNQLGPQKEPTKEGKKAKKTSRRDQSQSPWNLKTTWTSIMKLVWWNAYNIHGIKVDPDLLR